MLASNLQRLVWSAEVGRRRAEACRTRAHTWSTINRIILWAAAGTDDSHAAMEWMALAAKDIFIHLPGLHAEPPPGPAAVFDAWRALQSGLRALGIRSKRGLSE